MDTSEQKFNAMGHLALIVKPDVELTPQAILSVVFAADAMNPWQAVYKDGTLAKSIHWHSDLELQEEAEFTDRQYRLEIRPPFLISLEQLPAYIAYVQELARHITGFHLKGVISVSARVDFLGTNTSYRV